MPLAAVILEQAGSVRRNIQSFWAQQKHFHSMYIGQDRQTEHKMEK